MANELKFEHSPYLLQHASNPVDWFSWSKKAFDKAKKEGKLIFLSIGYSTCHWCHVMEEESFESKDVADILNRSFISIKVDREEMPDIDKYYQDIYFIINQRGGGWPLSLIMLPDRRVIFAATYIPREDRANMMGFKTLLASINKKFHSQKSQIFEIATSIENTYQRYENLGQPFEKIDENITSIFVQNIKKNFDNINKGISNAPKFPHASTIYALLELFSLTSQKEAFSMANDMLNAIKNGGINDQIEGGFYRYSVDKAWKIPHFEKMLYTNAELISAYSFLYAQQKDEDIKDVIDQTISAINERFLHEGLYFSASDADSEKEEGKYFVFDYDKAKNTLLKAKFTKSETDEILEYLNIDEFGNFENKTSNPYITSYKKPYNLQKAKMVLKRLRQEVSYPFIDKKILTSWNALFIFSLFEAGENVDISYLKMALTSLDKLIDTMYKNQILYHQILPNSKLKVEGLLEDYAFLSEVSLKAFSVTFDEKYLDFAKTLIELSEEKFYRNQRWYMGSFIALAPFEDSAYKSPLASIFSARATLALYENDQELFEKTQKMFTKHSANFAKYPDIYPSGLIAWIKLFKKETILKVPAYKLEEAQKMIKNLKNPLVHVIKSKESFCQACEISSCYAYGDDLSKVVDEIKKRYKY